MVDWGVEGDLGWGLENDKVGWNIVEEQRATARVEGGGEEGQREWRGN